MPSERDKERWQYIPVDLDLAKKFAKKMRNISVLALAIAAYAAICITAVAAAGARWRATVTACI